MTYFVRIVELRNITHAAEALHIAQPALSQQMAQLESTLGVQLLVRSPRGVEPTREGQMLYRQASTVLRQTDAIYSALGRTEAPITGPVSVGMASSTARMLALPLIRSTHEQFPAIDLEIVDVPSADLTLMVQQGRVDVALTPDQEAVSDLFIAPLVVEELLVLAHPSVKLPEGGLAITDLAGVPLILSRRPNKLRMRVDYAFMNARLQYRLLAQVSTSAILLPAVREGLGATILTYSAAYREIHAGAIRFYHLAPPLSREISLCTSRGALERPARQAVIELIRSLTETLIADGTWKYCKLA